MGKELIRHWSTSYILEHWVRVVAMTVLVFTGFYIHWPFLSGGPGNFIMAWMRFFHFVAAYALILGLVVRLYMAFNSRFDSDWKDFGIFLNLRNLPHQVLYYLFLKKDYHAYRKYNPLQAFAYMGIGLVILFAFLTGCALYHGKIFGFIKAPDSFRWVNNLLGGESYTRIWHFLSMWFFIIFTFAHVYMSLLMTAVAKDRTFSSIFTGYKLK